MKNLSDSKDIQMPMMKKTGIRKVAGRRVGAVRRRAGRRIPLPLKYNAKRVGGPNTARVTQTLPPIDILTNTPYIISVGGITGARALAHAEQYGLYRIARVTFKFKPLFDTFTPGLVNSIPGQNYIQGVPHLLWKMNRFADAPAAFTGDNLRSLGAKPIRLDDKTVTVSYKPNILTSIETGGSDSGQLKMTPWLNTDDSSGTAGFNPSTTEHFGHFFMVEAALINNSTAPVVGTFEATIYYEFKNPRVEWASQSQGAQPVQRPLFFTQSG